MRHRLVCLLQSEQVYIDSTYSEGHAAVTDTCKSKALHSFLLVNNKAFPGKKLMASHGERAKLSCCHEGSMLNTYIF